MNRSAENWTLARSIQPFPIDHGICPGCNGVVVAERHPTGWFIWAGFDSALPCEQIEDFTHFVVVRTYLLLEYGPERSAWTSDTVGVWRALCPSSTLDTDDGPVFR